MELSPPNRQLLQEYGEQGGQLKDNAAQASTDLDRDEVLLLDQLTSLKMGQLKSSLISAEGLTYARGLYQVSTRLQSLGTFAIPAGRGGGCGNGSSGPGSF